MKDGRGRGGRTVVKGTERGKKSGRKAGLKPIVNVGERTIVIDRKISRISR